MSRRRSTQSHSNVSLSLRLQRGWTSLFNSLRHFSARRTSRFHPFPRLPAHLRKRILEYHITPENIVVLANTPRGSRTPPAILLVNRQTYREAKPLFYHLPVHLICRKDHTGTELTRFNNLLDLQRLRNVLVTILLDGDDDGGQCTDTPRDLLAVWRESNHLENVHVSLKSDMRGYLRALARNRAQSYVENTLIRGMEMVSSFSGAYPDGSLITVSGDALILPLGNLTGRVWAVTASA